MTSVLLVTVNICLSDCKLDSKSRSRSLISHRTFFSILRSLSTFVRPSVCLYVRVFVTLSISVSLCSDCINLCLCVSLSVSVSHSVSFSLSLWALVSFIYRSLSGRRRKREGDIYCCRGELAPPV